MEVKLHRKWSYTSARTETFVGTTMWPVVTSAVHREEAHSHTVTAAVSLLPQKPNQSRHSESKLLRSTSCCPSEATEDLSKSTPCNMLFHSSDTINILQCCPVRFSDNTIGRGLCWQSKPTLICTMTWHLHLLEGEESKLWAQVMLFVLILPLPGIPRCPSTSLNDYLFLLLQ